jgi:hypothetical protein
MSSWSSALDERGVDGHHRVRAAHGQPGGHRDRVLLGDADVDHPVRKPALQRQEPGRLGHRGRDRHEAVALLGQFDQLLAEHRRERRGRRLQRLPGVRVHRAVAGDRDGRPVARSRRPRWASALASPSAEDSAVDGCEFSTRSCSDSSPLG